MFNKLSLCSWINRWRCVICAVHKHVNTMAWAKVKAAALSAIGRQIFADGRLEKGFSKLLFQGRTNPFHQIAVARHFFLFAPSKLWFNTSFNFLHLVPTFILGFPKIGGWLASLVVCNQSQCGVFSASFTASFSILPGRRSLCSSLPVTRQWKASVVKPVPTERVWGGECSVACKAERRQTPVDLYILLELLLPLLTHIKLPTLQLHVCIWQQLSHTQRCFAIGCQDMPVFLGCRTFCGLRWAW